MSLNWDATSLPAERLVYRWTDKDGQQHEQQCPKLHRFIWLTMTINRNMTGGPKAKAEFLKRFRTVRLIRPSLLTIEMGKANVDEHPEFWKGATLKPNLKHEVYEYELTEEDVETYWGLETNVWGRERYSKWLLTLVENLMKRY